MNKRWTVILAFCGVFAAGAVVGGLVVRRGGPPSTAPAQHRGPPPSTPDLDRFTPAIMRRYTARLELDDAQRDQLLDIVVKAEGELRDLRNSSFQETIAIGDRMNDQVALLLRADQHDRFEKLTEAVRNYWERERERRDGKSDERKTEKEEKRDEKKSEKRVEPKKPEKAEKRDDKREEPRKSEKTEKQEKPTKSEKSEKAAKSPKDAVRKPEKEKR